MTVLAESSRISGIESGSCQGGVVDPARVVAVTVSTPGGGTIITVVRDGTVVPGISHGKSETCTAVLVAVAAVGRAG
jgi:hypothetical protein